MSHRHRYPRQPFRPAARRAHFCELTIRTRPSADNARARGRPHRAARRPLDTYGKVWKTPAGGAGACMVVLESHESADRAQLCTLLSTPATRSRAHRRRAGAVCPAFPSIETPAMRRAMKPIAPLTKSTRRRAGLICTLRRVDHACRVCRPVGSTTGPFCRRRAGRDRHPAQGGRRGRVSRCECRAWLAVGDGSLPPRPSRALCSTTWADCAAGVAPAKSALSRLAERDRRRVVTLQTLTATTRRRSRASCTRSARSRTFFMPAT